jgi:hypothetical protein
MQKTISKLFGKYNAKLIDITESQCYTCECSNRKYSKMF